MSPNGSAERRSSTRFDKVFPVYLTSAHGISRGIARNVSEGGMFIETRDPHSLGKQITVSFVDDDAGVEIAALADVRYQCVLEYGSARGLAAFRGMGLRFVEFRPGGEPIAMHASRPPRMH